MKTLKAVFLTLLILLTWTAISEPALARKTLPGETQTLQADVEPVLIAILQISLAVCFILGLALMIPPKTRSAGASLFVGVVGVAFILYGFTNYMNSLADPLTGIMTNTGRVSDLLKPSGGGAR
jgi:hypothetical protein